MVTVGWSLRIFLYSTQEENVPACSVKMMELFTRTKVGNGMDV